ncbi:hypothetical protein BDR26DRAFT_1011521 [Obelidium mucronatum]|nr:hypothetical protein BDR26DRAFT_1011521 [Obelidium mucronatum]
MVLKNDDYDITSSQTTAISTKRRTFFRAVAAFAFLVILHAAFNHTWIKPQIQSSHREHRTPEHSLCSQRLSLKQLTLEVTASTVASSLSACTAARLQEAIRINTTSFTEVEATSIFTESPSNAKMKEEKNSASGVLDSFLQFHKFLKKEFPRIHESYNVTTINKASLIFEPVESEPKFLFYAHMDVVPGTGEDPFSGRFNENSGMIHGRGALDMKGILVSFLSALEAVLDACDMESTTSDKSSCLKKAKRWTIALGHDEETGGTHGAAKIAEYLAQKGALFEMILDEGVPATQNLIPLPGNPVIAFIGVAERGYMNCRLTISSEGGHSSVSKWSENPSHVLASTLNILDQKHPFPVPFWLLTNRLFNIVYDALGFPHIFGNVFSRNAMARPFISSTAAVTQFFAGAEGIMNVVPNTASALINIRVHPSDTAQSIPTAPGKRACRNICR